jgi:hypothetical protein
MSGIAIPHGKRKDDCGLESPEVRGKNIGDYKVRRICYIIKGRKHPLHDVT